MENASKALIIAGGVMLAVIIMSLIASFFAGVSEWPQQQDDTESKEQLAKFNQEYEVYAKSAMYGTDVISCLNKVVNFDEKYVEEDEIITNDDGDIVDYKGGWLSGTKYGGKDEFLIDVSVKFNKELEESLEVYHFKNEDDDTTQINLNANKEQLKTETDNKNEKYKATLSEAFENVPQIDKIKGGRDTYYTDLLDGDPPDGDGLYTRANSVEKDNITNNDKPISLLDEKKKQINKSGSLYKLASLSNLDLKVTIKNKDTDSKSLRKWSTVIWKTALYDLKTRRFRCDGIEYNAQTGRVNKISFSEI